ncbi:hypothetical protein BD289DRAFT_249518 [Coniella lustricola]|uniref:Secreted protein n=1 Tax=Coniella lustricola TaxID=2025994 RepID=A0A2T3A8M1_9PEZI|nr:hypothetical protein BD289DRAFT_249518 [Coniella lustricola]
MDGWNPWSGRWPLLVGCWLWLLVVSYKKAAKCLQMARCAASDADRTGGRRRASAGCCEVGSDKGWCFWKRPLQCVSMYRVASETDGLGWCRRG